MIAAPRSGSGKTTVTLGLLRAFKRAGLHVRGAKCGPDYIDPMFHMVASGRSSVNLDSWAMRPALLSALATQASIGCDLVLCEALMGLFDGVPGPAGQTGSSADVAAILSWPVILVIDVSGQSQSAAALIKGCADYDPRINIAGVVLNRVGSPRHSHLITEAVEALGIPVVGALPRSNNIALPERHLGLVQANETNDLEARLEQIADFIVAHVKIDTIRSLALRSSQLMSSRDAWPVMRPPGQRIAVARDAAFSFFYSHLLHSWRASGASIHFFSPLADEGPNDICDVCWLPGGYPELHAGRLSSSQRFFRQIRRFAETRPVHGECGGYMVLGASMTDLQGRIYPMVDLLGISTSFAQRKLHLGYRHVQLSTDGCLGSAGTLLRGHEFHYASVVALGHDMPFATVDGVYGSNPVPVGSRRGHTTGSFFHMIASVS